MTDHLPPYHNKTPITKNTLITGNTQSPKKNKNLIPQLQILKIPHTTPEHRQNSSSCPLQMPDTETGKTLGRKTSRTQPNSLKHPKQPLDLLVLKNVPKVDNLPLPKSLAEVRKIWSSIYLFYYLFILLDLYPTHLYR